MKSYEKLLKDIRKMQSVIHHIRRYGMYEKLLEHMKSNQNSRRTADPFRPLTDVKL
jgi:hypothetical protein